MSASNISFFWRDGRDSKLKTARKALALLRMHGSVLVDNEDDSTGRLGCRAAESVEWIHQLISREISDRLNIMRMKKNWVVAYRADIHHGRIVWGGASWTSDRDENGNPWPMEKEEMKKMKRYAVP